MVFLPPILTADGTPRESIRWKDRAYFSVIIIGNVIFFAIFGGALLTRYLLPVYPLVILLCINSLWRRLPPWYYAAIFSALAFAAGLFINPPYQFAPEDNLEYVAFIHLQQEAIRQIQRHYPHQAVLTAWPASDELTKPMLGYVKHPIPVVPIRDFDIRQIHRAAAMPGRYGVALVFSTKYDPPDLFLNLGSWNNGIDKRFFDFHKDLQPKDIASQLGGTVVWEKEEKGEWAAIINFNLPPPDEFSPAKPRGSL
jgi:hypothetical protein